MAVMLNMIPLDQKQITSLPNLNGKNSTKSNNFTSGFAKTLNNETSKSGTDVDPKPANNDPTQLMAVMAGMVVPLAVNLAKVDQVDTANAGTVENTPNATQGQLANVVAVPLQNQLANVVAVPLQNQLANVVAVPLQNQLTNIVSAPLQDQLANTVSAPLQNQLTNTVSAPLQDQLANTVAVPLQNQLTNAVPAPLQGQLVSDSGLPKLFPQRDGTTTPAENTQVSELPELQISNRQILKQVEVTDFSIKNIEIGTQNNVVSKGALSLANMGNANVLGNNSNKQFEDKKITVGQLNVEATESANEADVTESVVVKPVPAPQGAMAAVDRFLSGNKENVEVPNQTVTNSDVFTSMLNQQGMKIENQASLEVKQVPVQQGSDSYNIASQIVEQARLVTGVKNTEMIIQLKPEHLGELTFKVSVENGVISASFHSNNSEVRSAIESTLAQLKQDMATQGLKIDNVGVYSGLGQFFSNGQQSGSYQQPIIKIQNNKNEDDFLEAFEATDTAERNLDVNGVDYRA